jgi:hypothetical protein
MRMSSFKSLFHNAACYNQAVNLYVFVSFFPSTFIKELLLLEEVLCSRVRNRKHDMVKQTAF